MRRERDLFQPPPLDDVFRQWFVDFPFVRDQFVFLAVCVDVVVAAMSLEVPTILLQEFNQIPALRLHHLLATLILYTLYAHLSSAFVDI